MKLLESLLLRLTHKAATKKGLLLLGTIRKSGYRDTCSMGAYMSLYNSRSDFDLAELDTSEAEFDLIVACYDQLTRLNQAIRHALATSMTADLLEGSELRPRRLVVEDQEGQIRTVEFVS